MKKNEGRKEENDLMKWVFIFLSFSSEKEEETITSYNIDKKNDEVIKHHFLVSL